MILWTTSSQTIDMSHDLYKILNINFVIQGWNLPDLYQDLIIVKNLFSSFQKRRDYYLFAFGKQ